MKSAHPGSIPPTLSLISALLSFVLATQANAADVRKFSFATEYPTGTITVVSPTESNPRPPQKAIGTISINAPPNSIFILDINPHCIEHPERLKNLPTSGIDEIRLSFMSLDDSNSQCDKALSAMPLFKHLTALDCTRTDVTDSGVLAFKSLSSLERLDCFMSNVDGSFLRDTTRLQNLKDLRLSNDMLKSENLKTLPQLQNVQSLDLSLTDLNDEGLQYASRLKNLKALYLSSNPKITDVGVQSLQNCIHLKRLDIAFDRNITDVSIPILQKMTQLTYLNLDSTKITESALEKLSTIKSISRLVQPQHYWKVDQNKLQKSFPSNVLKFGSREITRDIQIECAPLK